MIKYSFSLSSIKSKKSYCFNIEGLEIEIEASSKEELKERQTALQIRAIRYLTGLNRKEFCSWIGIPYRTVQEWELGGRTMPDYVMHLIAYKVNAEKNAGHI